MALQLDQQYTLHDASRIYGKDTSHLRNIIKREGIQVALTPRELFPHRRGMPKFMLTILGRDLERLIQKRDRHS